MLHEPATTQLNNEETTGYILEHASVKPVNDISPHRLAMGGMGSFCPEYNQSLLFCF
jgi:hypothetical protein